MASIPSLLNNFSSFLQNHQVSFTNGLLILFTLGGEQIFRFTAFDCPCQQDEAFIYACSFIFGPTVVLIIIGVVVNNLTWRLVHGCWHRSENCKHGFCKSLEHCIAVLARSFIVPCAWIFIIFLDGNYYVCMKSSAYCEKDSEENKHLKAVSQIISWAFLIALVGLASIVIFITRCIDSVTFMQYKYINIYREVEAQRLDETMKVAANDLAKINVKNFIEHPRIKKEDWDVISKAPEHRIQLNECPLAYSYTPLHQWQKKYPLSTEAQGQIAVNTL